MINAVQGLTRPQLDAIAELEARVLAADGGRLKLEWGVLNSRPKDHVHDFLCWAESDNAPGHNAASRDSSERRLIGFAGIYAFGSATPELAGMVDPEYRRRGIGTALLDAAAIECGRRGDRTLLLVTPRNGSGGSEFAARHGIRLKHSEHAMLLSGDSVTALAPASGSSEDAPPSPAQIMEPSIIVRQAVPADIPGLDQILAEAFGYSIFDGSSQLEHDRWRQLTVERDGEVIGCLRASLEDRRGAIYGFAIAAAQRGNGIGREVLHRACVDLHERGADEIALEVATDNDRALGLYESIGFERIITEDYYELLL